MFVSYTDQLEDVLLHRALYRSAGIKKGFYVDIGACYPEFGSVTKGLYDLGWNGINVEPNPDIFKLLSQARPKDINLDCAIGEELSTLEFYSFDGVPGLSTFDAEIAQRHAIDFAPPTIHTVKVRDLASILDEYLPQGQEIHFLKIDVEGFEHNVLKGNNWDKFRPWLLVIEATAPMSPMETHSQWEPLVLGNGYDFGFADGVNRYYYRSDKKVFQELLRYPPNFFDDFKRASDLQKDLVISDLTAKLQSKTAELEALRSSMSWRITHPLRCGLNVRNVALALNKKDSRLSFLVLVVGKMYENRFLRTIFQQLLSLTPRLRMKLQSRVSSEVSSKSFIPDLTSKPFTSLESSMLNKIEHTLGEK